MSYLAGVKKEDLRSLCEDLGLTITSKMSVLDLKNLIINDTKYDEEFTREHLKGIIQHRKSDYEQKLREIESERAFELEKVTTVTATTISYYSWVGCGETYS
ncbi:uncharacterized protein NPIL_94871 [Nephila pilipes]|uniref:Uncharacterized protein n=1 Tax=Nephila pilipes TaxID=299642 RepID=A0A8X6U411_NEPPI|nr:uncharacterized protein NPIL_94871 [Nephila pilipes]